MKIIAASTNPVKIAATEEAFRLMFPDQPVEVIGMSSPSGVPDQPIGDPETLQGAVNRVAFIREQVPEADFWVGLEGGIGRIEGGYEAFGWMVVSDPSGQLGKSRTSSFALPPAVCHLIDSGKELGHAMDEVFAAHNTKQKGGAIGILTDGVIDRKNLYIPAVVMAIIRFKQPELFPVAPADA
ncbi:inosine/xanthosine triphosphatase [Pontibacter sp. G13]|uniref:inosine/xanthosine triphosphatase n=1 Tax=Pontibacter sp. G13 TaxID=3074898 RepID=UPI002889EDF6|nr:inosine/xanthosine triphosphatase [Pontibacter sp. G13]WNJ16876.1 inosine/xanthosine triphosphatase [Pontibacter sp. G13]